MVRTRTFEDPILDIPEGSIEHGHEPVATTGHTWWLDEEASGEWWASWGQAPATMTSREGFFILRFSSNSLASLCQCVRPVGGGQLAPHHGVHVWATSLYRVSEDSVHSIVAQRLSWSLVGFTHHRPTYWSPYSMGWVPCCLSHTPPICGSALKQAEGVPGPWGREPQCSRLHEAVQHSCSVQGMSHRHRWEEGQPVPHRTDNPPTGAPDTVRQPIIQWDCECGHWSRENDEGHC
jgi:hypothetical protein